jgi:hypothetical protein
MSIAASKENQTIIAQQEVFISSMDKAAARASVPDILHGAKAISSKSPRAALTVSSLPTPPHHPSPRQSFCSLQEDGRALHQAGDQAPQRDPLRCLYTGPGSAKILGASEMDDAPDLQGGENYCKELLCRLCEYWDNTFHTIEKTENTARQRDFCTRTRLDLSASPTTHLSKTALTR